MFIIITGTRTMRKTRRIAKLTLFDSTWEILRSISHLTIFHNKSKWNVSVKHWKLSKSCKSIMFAKFIQLVWQIQTQEQLRLVIGPRFSNKLLIVAKCMSFVLAITQIFSNPYPLLIVQLWNYHAENFIKYIKVTKLT